MNRIVLGGNTNDRVFSPKHCYKESINTFFSTIDKKEIDTVFADSLLRSLEVNADELTKFIQFFKDNKSFFVDYENNWNNSPNPANLSAKKAIRYSHSCQSQTDGVQTDGVLCCTIYDPNELETL